MRCSRQTLDVSISIKMMVLPREGSRVPLLQYTRLTFMLDNMFRSEKKGLRRSTLFHFLFRQYLRHAQPLHPSHVDVGDVVISPSCQIFD